MPRLTRIAEIAACLLLSALGCMADDMPRVSLTVSKRTIVQPTAKTPAGAEKGRVQALIVLVENSSSHSLPEGQIRWTAVVRKAGGGSLKYTGTEVLKPLRSFQSAEIQCGAFEIDSRLGATAVERDRIDYDLVLLHNEKESARTFSVSNFAALAEKAEPVTREPDAAAPKVANNEEDPVPGKRKRELPAAAAIIGAEKIPPQKPAMPVAEIAKPVEEPPPVPQQKFDFFNLGGKKAPAAN
ncbi:MAG: hypothetical protein ABI318_01935 [Chthoniobacteraceae bacterium]